jgi:hypothetical protein
VLPLPFSAEDVVVILNPVAVGVIRFDPEINSESAVFGFSCAAPAVPLYIPLMLSNIIQLNDALAFLIRTH